MGGSERIRERELKDARFLLHERRNFGEVLRHQPVTRAVIERLASEDVPSLILALEASEERASAVEGELEGARERARRLGRASADLLDSLHAYYFYDDDRELHAINALRRLLGLREQMPKCCEAEAEADIAEGKAVPDHETYHRKLHGLDAASEAREGQDERKEC